MENINRNIIENKNAENTEIIKYKKDILFDIKQSLFQQLTTQSSRKLNNKDSEENTYKNPKYQNYLNFKKCEESNSIYYDHIVSNDEKSQIKNSHKYKINLKNNEINSENKKNKNKNKRISIIKNDNDIMTDFLKCQNKNKNLLNDSNSNEKTNKDNVYKFNNYNNDSIYILSTQKSENENEDESESNLDSYEILESHITLPFCYYHKYNIQLPKQYTCNFKNCSCCGCLMKKRYQMLEGYNGYRENQDYIYPVNKTENKKAKFGSVLDKFKKKKNRCTLTEESNQLGDFGLKPLKPNNTNLKIKKTNYIIENCDDEIGIRDNEKQNSKKYYYKNNNKYGSNSKNLNNKNKNDNKNEEENNYSDNNIYSNENYISEKDPENSFNDSNLLELPYEENDDKNLKRYKYLVNKNDNKSKIHFSVLYYKRLNKSYNQIYSKDFKDNQSNFNIKGINKNKNIEFLRE